MRKGKMCAQAAHASLGSFLKFAIKDTMFRPSQGYLGIKLIFKVFYKTPLHEWLEGIFTKIVVGCDSEEELLELHQKVEEAGIENVLIVDAGKTEFHGKPTYTALAIGPAYSHIIDNITGHLKLL